MGGPDTSIAINDLKNQLDDLHLQFSSVKCEVYEAVRAFYTQSSTIPIEDAISFAKSWSSDEDGELHSRINRLEENLLHTIDQLQAEHKLSKCMSENQRTHAQITTSKHVISTLRLLVKIDDEINTIETYLDQDELLKAGQLINDIEKNLGDLPKAAEDGSLESSASGFPETADLHVFQVIQNQYISCKTRFDYRVKQTWNEMCVLSTDKLTIRSSLNEIDGQLLSSPMSLEQVWQALTLSNGLEKHIKEWTEELRKVLLKPLLINLKVQRDENVLSWSSRGKTDNTLSVCCQNIKHVIGFISEKVLFGDFSKVCILGRYSWSSRSGLQGRLKDLLAQSVPNDSSALDAFRQEVAQTIGALESYFVDIQYIESSQCITDGFLADLNTFYGTQKRKMVLIKAREIMKRDYMNAHTIVDATERTTLDSNSVQKKKDTDQPKGYFYLPQIQVTKCTHELVELSHQTLIEACSSTEAVARVLTQTARDLLILFKAIVPTLYEEDIANEARIAMLFYNDCLYIAHHMLIIGHQYREQIPQPFTMIDMVSSFRQTALEKLTAFTQNASDSMLAQLTQCPSFALLDAPDLVAQAESVVKAMVSRFHRIGNTWQSGLEESVFHTALGSLLYPLIEWFLRTVLDQSSVPYEATKQIVVLLHMVEELRTLFKKPVEEYVTNFKKFKAVVRVLELSILEIKQRYKQFELEVVPEELATILWYVKDMGLIQARSQGTLTRMSPSFSAYFDDSIERQSFLQALRG